MQCPCGLKQSYEECCGPFIEGKRHPETAEQLMRARYTAYTRAELDFIASSHDPKTRAEFDVEGARAWATQSEWQGLEILKTSEGAAGDQEGTVEFVAQYKVGEQEVRHHELALFRKVKGHWFFVDGKNLDAQTFVRAEPKVGRNDPCTCGSGKKYKKCCGA